MPERKDGGILIDAPRRCVHTQTYVIYSEWTAVDTEEEEEGGKKHTHTVLILTTERTILAIRDQMASGLLSIRNLSAAKIRRTNPHSLPR